MTTLKEAIARSGWSQQDLADVLGVSRVSVSRWVNGHEPVPRSRASTLRRFVGDFEAEMTEEDLLVKPDPHVTFFGWWLDRFGDHLGETWKQRVEAFAASSEVDPFLVQEWADGKSLIPSFCISALKRAWPGMNLLAFQWEVGEYIDEPYAVQLALREAAAGKPQTFKDVRETLREVQKRYLKNPVLHNTEAVKLALWRATDVVEMKPEGMSLVEMARRFRDERENQR